MPAITQDPLRPEALKGVEDPRQLLTALNRLQSEAGAVLNGGATLANAWRVVLPGVEIVTPDEWTALTPLNSFADIGPTNSAGSLAVRKLPNGLVELREAVNRPAGAPASFTPIANLPAGHGPSAALRRVADAAGAHGVYDVIPASGATPAKVRWVAGTPTTAFWLAGGMWEAADKSLPAWPTPVTVRLADRRIGTSTSVSVRHVLCAARTADGSAGILSTVSFPGAYIQAPSKPDEPRLLVLPRIDGLLPNLRYSLTLWAFLE